MLINTFLFSNFVVFLLLKHDFKVFVNICFMVAL